MLWFVSLAWAIPGDADDDGVPDAAEDRNGDGDLTNDDTDGDGHPDHLDPDDDGDGVPTLLEDHLSPGDPRGTNTDAPNPADPLDLFARGDAIPDYLDPDDDGDGILTRHEDADGDGPLNDNWDLDVLSPQLPGMPACPSGQQPVFCYDDLPDYLDPDDDGDGVPTFAEVELGTDPFDPDSDDDGFFDGDEWINALNLYRVPIDQWLSAGACAADLTDSDADVLLERPGLAGFVTWAEVQPGDVVVGGIFDQDLDFDGIPDGIEGRAWLLPWDRDCDGHPNVLDIDDDGDGYLTGVYGPGGFESAADVDCAPGGFTIVGDGIPNYLDTDSDGSASELLPGTHPACPWAFGAPVCVLTTDAEEPASDSDDDFAPDPWDCTHRGPGQDMDRDGLSDAIEAAICPLIPAPCGAPHPYGDRTCGQNPDSDCDGLLDCEEAGVGCDSVLLITGLGALPDTDGDGVANLFDPDDDGDGIPTHQEITFGCPVGSLADPTSLVNPHHGAGPDTWSFACTDDTGLVLAILTPTHRDDDDDGVPDHLDAPDAPPTEQPVDDTDVPTPPSEPPVSTEPEAASCGCASPVRHPRASWWRR